MMQIVHDIAPGSSLAFYTAANSEQDFANGILALAAAGCKVICDDVSYFDEPFFQNGIVAQAIQTVEAEGVTYVTAAGNNASNAYQASWTPGSGSFDGWYFSDAELFNGSLAQTITVTASTSDPVPLLLEWNEAYGQANFNSGQAPDIDLFVFHNGSLVAQETNATAGEPNNPFTGYEFTASGTYQIVIANNFGPDPGLIKEILFGNGLPETISGANAGTVYGHAMTPGVIAAGAVNAADTPAFGVSPVSETFSSSGAGTELLFANNGAALSSPDVLSPVAVSGIDDIATTVPGGLQNFYGTSAASASLAGVAALILSADPSLTPAQVEAIMEQTALPMANSAVSGAGLVQVNPAVAAALQDSAVVIQTDGTTSLVQVGWNYFLNPVGGGTGPELMRGGSAVFAGEFGTWAPIGAVQVAGGYDVAWKDPSSGLYTVWSTDSNGNYLANLIPAVPGNSTSLETLETTFHQDLNGDGTIGLPTKVIQTDGSTTLTEVGNNFYLYTN
ncbi:S8 family serine peptidase, partial [Bradyrhizobium sp. Tv2a-2]|uniref:S8 family serine peptidase n=1 Tax=Bradyrhizobium sp. Tv2a-2 TaxID=113395 RepID=UPI001FD93D83